jgi:rhodanese-related sulfurtransferase
MDRLSPEDAKRQIDDGATLIDIRSQKEFADAHIPGAVLLPAALIDADCAPQIKNGQVVFYCASGARTNAARPAIEASGFTHAAYIDGGMNAWRSAGLPVKAANGKAPTFDIQRQVQITVGILLLISTTLSFILSPMLAIAGALIGAGLLMAGLTGTCMMATALMWMPWNRSKKQNQIQRENAHA